MRGNRISVALAIAVPVGVAIGAAISAPAHAQFDVDIRIGYAPPPLPDENGPYYEQPPLPGPDYIWVPGTWAWSDEIDDYYWVPGYWDLPPEPGLLWTPAWWGWDYNAFRYHPGYWGYQVGWYGGIDYGHGYHGHGWDGGHWDHGHVAYNRAVINVTNINVRNVYYAPVQRSDGGNRGPRVSYNGGNGGIAAQPRPEEIRATQGQHFAPTQAQQQRTSQAAANPRAAASRITPAWNPPAARRVGNDGAPVGRGGAQPGFQQPGYPQPGYQQQRPNPGVPGGVAPRPYQAAPNYSETQRPSQPTPGAGQVPRAATLAPTYARPIAPQTHTPPQGNSPQAAPPQATSPQGRSEGQPNPNYGRAAPPPVQFHPPTPVIHTVAPPPPRPAPPPPPKPQPQPQHNDRDHQNHQ